MNANELAIELDRERNRATLRNDQRIHATQRVRCVNDVDRSGWLDDDQDPPIEGN